jgi:signal transduction histidine kinase
MLGAPHHGIAGLNMQAEMLERSGRQDAPSFQQLTQTMDRALVELHRLASDLRPAALDRVGLAAAVRQYCAEFRAKYGLVVECRVEELEGVRLPAEVETCAYRVLQQALSTSALHAGPAHVKIELARGDGTVRLEGADDGVGFDVAVAEAQGALGLVAMAERAAAVHGTLKIESAAGVGTRVILELPDAVPGALSPAPDQRPLGPMRG